MPSSPNKLSRFWQELKRRNVIRVITVYTGAAFVILSLVDMIREPFELPNWSFKLVVVILFVGLIIAVILSWIYDILPERGMVKTEPADKINLDDVPKSSKGWKIASYISFVVIVGLIALNVIPRTGNKEILDKSIAVLPFDNDGPVSENAAYLNGYRTAIHSDLCKIKDLRVHNLQSTEQYRDQAEFVPEIAKNLGVAYVLSARGQIINNRVRITVYLTDASDEIIWSHPYDRQIEVVADHIDIQSEIAQLVAKELRATITPEELEIIESIPTSDMAAYDHFQRAENEIMEISLNPVNASRYNIIQERLIVAREHYKLAIASDPGFADAYVGLGKVHNINYDISGSLSEVDLDSVLYYAERALAYNDRLASAYTLKGQYLYYSGNFNLALEEFEVAKELNPNDVEVYRNLGRLYDYIDGAKAIYNSHKAYKLVSGDQRRSIRDALVFRYASLGLFEEANDLAENSIRIDGDSTDFMRYQATIEMCRGNYEKCIEWQFRVHRYDPQIPLSPLSIARFYGYLRQYTEALTYAEQYLEQEGMTNWSEYTGRHHMALIYWHTGFREKALELVHDQIAYQLELIEQGGVEEIYGMAYFDLFLCHAFLGDKTEAYKNYYLYINKNKNIVRWAQVLTYLKDDPLADNLRDDEEYHQIVRQFETEFLAQRERIRLWLEENDML